MKPFACLAAALLVMALCGCGAASPDLKNALAAGGGEESGPSSGLWGDTGSGPKGMSIGCIHGRRFAVLITVHNKTDRTLSLVGATGSHGLPGVIDRVAVQVRLAPPPPKGDLVVTGLRSWNARNSPPAVIPPGRDGWVQSNFLMRNCALLDGHGPVTLNRSATLIYKAGATTYRQVVAVPSARIILARGPLHPSLPVNQVG
jgi:hypothetical protein